ncbi:MAG: fibronectin type III domain-containing protein, partial [Flavobacteriaceae bacterium]|nr:fibronectin type III domain-containing protein [Flavobacteriaceae bacterium]
DVDGKSLGEYGMASEQQVVETTEPMSVTPTEIGENFVEVQWHREKRHRDAVDDAITITRTTVKIVSYELKLVRLDDAADEPLPNDLRITKTFGVATQNFVCHNLLPNAIYAVQVRSQTEGEHWGLWSATTKFVTQKRLTVRVELVNEDNFLLSWTRMLPDWIKDKPSAGLHSDEASSMVEDGDGGAADDRASEHPDADSATGGGPHTPTTTVVPPPAAPSELDKVILGDYSVRNSELVVEGVTNAFTQALEFTAASVTARVTGLAQDNIYTVCVRSRALSGTWSLHSAKVSVCTLKAMDVKLQRGTECMASVRWFRAPQSVSEHEKALKKQQLDIQRAMDQREK